MEQRESETVDNKKMDGIDNRTFRTIIGTHFVDLKNVTELELSGKICQVDGITIKHCSITWALRSELETWGVKSIGVRPVIVKVDTVIDVQLDGEQNDVEIQFKFIPEMSKMEIDTTEFNPLINGIVPTGVEITIKEGEPANVKIKF